MAGNRDLRHDPGAVLYQFGQLLAFPLVRENCAYVSVFHWRKLHLLQDVGLPVVVDDDGGRVTAVRVVHFDLEVASSTFHQRDPRLVGRQQFAQPGVLKRQSTSAVVVAAFHVNEDAVGDADVRLAELAGLRLLRVHVTGNVIIVRDVYVGRRVRLRGLVAVAGKVGTAGPIVGCYC